MMRRLYFLILLLVPAFAFSQDKVLFTNGKEKEVSVVGIDDYNIIYHLPNKGKQKKFRKENIFSITRLDGKEEIIYNPDTLGFLVLDVVEPELDYTVEEMRRYIYGRQDGMKVKSLAPALISGSVGLVGAGLGAFFGPIAPSVYIIILGVKKQKPDDRLVDHPEYVFDEAYLDGYHKSARKKKIIAAAEGGLVGLAAGILVYQTAFRGWK